MRCGEYFSFSPAEELGNAAEHDLAHKGELVTLASASPWLLFGEGNAGIFSTVDDRAMVGRGFGF